MNRKPLDHDASFENDAVWKLLDNTPPAIAGPRFVDDTVRAARLAGQAEPWWKSVFSPAPLAGIAAAAAAIALGVFTLPVLLDRPADAPTQHSFVDSERAAEIQDIAEAETLMVAVDHLDEFSDTELVSLIGF
jgi:hypothetical protein